MIQGHEHDHYASNQDRCQEKKPRCEKEDGSRTDEMLFLRMETQRHNRGVDISKQYGLMV